VSYRTWKPQCTNAVKAFLDDNLPIAHIEMKNSCCYQSC